MSLNTPRQRGLARASTNSSPNLLGASTTARKASYNALNGRGPATPASKMHAEFSIGELVNVPGEMYGTVKFVGSVKGKAGRFIGVELSREFASRGKNNGDVEGTRYFTTSVPGAGIFLPVARAERRASPALSFDSFPGTPSTPSYANYNATNTPAEYTPPTPAMPKFSQSVGPGARAPSPQFKPKSRPSLPRPESPLRKQPTLAPTPARNFSMSQRGIAPPRFTASPAPPRVGTPKAAPRATAPTRPYSRNSSRLGNRADSVSGATQRGSVGGAQPSNGTASAYPRRSPSRMANTDQEDEIQRLIAQLEEKDRQLKDQANSLSEMEMTLKEIQEMMPSDGGAGDDGGDTSSLRRALAEKSDKIQSMVAEFDGHRADFRSTIDTLELASAETERVYEAKVGDLLAEIQELREMSHNHEDVEHVAEQLKSLEELVAELEEGLEDARRGEAEARGEVEFLRGEVERGRSELRREREKAAKALQGAKEAEGMRSSTARDRDVQMKDDEIRGLKAVIHSLSSGPEVASPMGRDSPAAPRFNDDELKRTQAIVQQLEREKSELQGLVERKGFREEELERAVEQLRKAAQQERSSIMRGTISPGSHVKDAVKPTEQIERHEDHTFEQSDEHLEQEIAGMLGGLRASSPKTATDGDEFETETGLEKTKSNGSDVKSVEERPATATSQAAADKWCALCEEDGHLAFDCPNENY
ncbi:hypothetical protein MBLNU459_g4640t1 [Dothideomycetes sp. NU459]